MKKKTYTIALSVAAAALSLASCVKDELYNTPHPDLGMVRVTTDWNGRSSETVVPDKYTLRIGERSQEASGGTSLFEALFNPGSYTLLVHNTPEDITVNGTTATVRPMESGGIAPMPGYLFASSRDIYVQADDTLEVTVPMLQFVRRLDIGLTVTEGDYDRVATATATLGGIASTVDVATGGRGGEATAANGFTQDGDKFSAVFRLLGVIPTADHILTVNVLFTNGDTQTIVSDISEWLEGFNESVEPLKLTGELLLPVEGGFSGMISGWQQADGGNTDAH